MRRILGLFLLLIACGIARAEHHATTRPVIELRAWGVPDSANNDPDSLAKMAIIDAFQKKHPNIKPVSTTGLQFGSAASTRDMVPLMQIAGDVAPHVLDVNFRQSDTYIRNKFLYPLDKYIAAILTGVDLNKAHTLDNAAYIELLKKSPEYKTEIEDRIPAQLWKVIRRDCPYHDDCPYLKQAGQPPAHDHYHIWAFPQEISVTAMFYRRDLFSEAGLPDRAPETMDELYDWAKRLTYPPDKRYGLNLYKQDLGWSTLTFLYGNGGRVVEQDKDGNWRCCFDTPQSVNAYYFVSRLLHQPFENRNQTFDSIIATEENLQGDIKVGMQFLYLNDRFFSRLDPQLWGFGPVPKGPDGTRAAEFNGIMTGIYAGIESQELRDAAWDYIRFYGGRDAVKIRANIFVENGSARFLTRKMLEIAGYPEYIKQIPAGWEESLKEAMESGVPEPYGKNCQQVYRYLSQAVDQIRIDPTITKAVENGDEATAKLRIKEILEYRVTRSNEKMLDILTPAERKFRNTVATIVAITIFIVFVLVFWFVFKTFSKGKIKAVDQPRVSAPPGAPRWPFSLLLRSRKYGDAPKIHAPREGHWQFGKYVWAYLLLFPAVGSIALWSYYPLLRGTTMAFQDYNVRGFSRWVGMENFANVLFDSEFWFAMWVSLKWAAFYVLFGFFTPIILAFLLSEIPRGRLLFRTIFYLPAVLSGVVVIFLWRGFYDKYGMINGVINVIRHALNHLPGVNLADIHVAWLEQPEFALFFCLLPVIWAGMGPGCLIYLAALKTVPEEIYEAADIDGAGIRHKMLHIALPGIKSLVAINFIGVMIHTIKGGSEMVLAMTGGGPYTPNGQTEVVGLHIYWQAYGYLRFGQATAMAWVLGSMLIGFTVLQLTRLSRVEFRAAGAKA